MKMVTVRFGDEENAVTAVFQVSEGANDAGILDKAKTLLIKNGYDINVYPYSQEPVITEVDIADGIVFAEFVP